MIERFARKPIATNCPRRIEMPIGPKTFTLEQIEEAMEDYIGFCTECGAERDSCEPDAREYECYDCSARSVYGAEELLIMGKVE